MVKNKEKCIIIHNEVVYVKAKGMKKYVMILVAFLIIFSFNTVNANVNQKLIEEAQKLEKWDNLPEEEKINQGLTYNSVSLNESVKRSTYNKLLGGNVSALESKYSLLDKLPNGSITVRNQGYTELCWAFSYASVLDTTAAMKNNKTYRFSAIHSDYVATKYFNKVKGSLGNFEIALATSVSGEGPVYEADMPFESYYKETGNEYEYEISYDGVEEEKLQARAKINETYSFPAISKTYTKTAVKYLDSMDNEYSNEELTLIRTQIKQHIKKCGALLASTYMGTDEKLFSKGENGSFAYCNKNTSYKQNHAVTIIGWDDTYSKENFADSEYKPLSDGAYIVLNSYGESLLPYFYVSYEDSLIENYVRGIKNIQVYSEEEKNYDNLYQYDETGENFPNYEVTLKGASVKDINVKDINVEDITLEGEIYTANVFKRKDSTKKEYVEEVGIYVPITEGIEIYVDAKNGDMKDYGETVAVYTGNNALEPGYHAIKLGTPIEVTGEKFAIIVKYINAEGAKYSLECNLNDTELTANSNIWSKAKAEAGQSFISTNGNEWEDINGYEFLYWSLTGNMFVKKTYKNTNACIKAFTKVEEPKIDVKSVNLNENSITIEEGKTYTLIATVLPENATDQNVIWSSADESIVTVQNGVIEGKGPGKTTVTVTTVDKELKASCEVTVEAKPISVDSVELDKTSITIEIGKTEVLIATVKPDNATNKKINWSSTDESVATVENGVIEGKKVGKAIVRVTTDDGKKTASCEVTVKNSEKPHVSVESVNLNKNSITIEEGTTEVLIATVKPDNATNKKINWLSTNESIVTVQNGVIEGKKAGKTLITVTTDDGEKMATCEVTVEAKPISVDSVELDKTSITIEIGKTEVLIATVKPDNATNKKINWSSTDESVATVENGVIEGKKVGKAIVRVTTDDGKKTASCEVTVKNSEKPHVSVESVNLNKNSITIEEGTTEVLIATVKPDNATNKKINWLSTNESIVTVQNGVIEGKKAGKTLITVTTDDGEKMATCEVTVEEGKPEIILVNSVKLNKTETTIEEGTTETLIATVLPENATNQKVNWESEDESTATVTGGVITGKKAGKTVITVTTEEGEKTASCEVTVKEKETEKISVESISLNTNNETIENGTILNLMLTFNPSNATNKNVKWESSNEKVAVVNGNGIVKAVGEGKTTIKVTSEDGNKEATCEITVTKKVNKDDDIYSTKDDNTVSDRKLPKTGLKVIIMVLIGLSLFTIIKFIKYRNLKDIK